MWEPLGVQKWIDDTAAGAEIEVAGQGAMSSAGALMGGMLSPRGEESDGAGSAGSRGPRLLAAGGQEIESRRFEVSDGSQKG